MNPNQACLPGTLGFGLTAEQRAQPSFQPTEPAPTMPTEVTKVTNTAQDQDFPAKFTAIFNMSERFAYSHINFPSSARDGMMSSYIKSKLSLVAGNSAGHLMSNGQTRYHIVTRIMNEWISKHVLKRSCFGGFDKQADANIERLANLIYQCRFRCCSRPTTADKPSSSHPYRCQRRDSQQHRPRGHPHQDTSRLH